MRCRICDSKALRSGDSWSGVVTCTNPNCRAQYEEFRDGALRVGSGKRLNSKEYERAIDRLIEEKLNGDYNFSGSL